MLQRVASSAVGPRWSVFTFFREFEEPGTTLRAEAWDIPTCIDSDLPDSGQCARVLIIQDLVVCFRDATGTRSAATVARLLPIEHVATKHAMLYIHHRAVEPFSCADKPPDDDRKHRTAIYQACPIHVSSAVVI